MSWLALSLPTLLALSARLPGQGPTPSAGSVRIAPVRGLAVVHAEHTPNGDREAVTTVEDASPSGLRYLDVFTTGDTVRGEHTRFVRAADLDTAPRLHLYYEEGGAAERPGYTAWSLSTAAYRQLRSTGTLPYAIMSLERLAK